MGIIQRGFAILTNDPLIDGSFPWKGKLFLASEQSHFQSKVSERGLCLFTSSSILYKPWKNCKQKEKVCWIFHQHVENFSKNLRSVTSGAGVQKSGWATPQKGEGLWVQYLLTMPGLVAHEEPRWSACSFPGHPDWELQRCPGWVTDDLIYRWYERGTYKPTSLSPI